MLQSLSTIGVILGAMALIALVETVIPLKAQHRAHVGPNLALTFIAFATNLVLGAGLMAVLTWTSSPSLLPPIPSTILAVVALDFSVYVAHLAMHKVPLLWRFHRVHHSDPAVDVTTTIRQHPGEGLIRYAFLAVAAVVIGVGPAAFAIYRAVSAFVGLLEHANVRVPRWLDTALSYVTTWPGMHKIHHCREQALTDSNYGNVFSWWDRLFGTFTPLGAKLDYGLDDCEGRTTAGLLALPFRK